MKYFRLVVFTGLAGLLILGLFAMPNSRARAQTPASDLEREQTAGTKRLDPNIPSGNTEGFQHSDGSLEFGTYVNGVYTQVSFFGPALVAASASGPVTFTDPKTGFQTTLETIGNNRIATIRDALRDALGNVVQTYVIPLQ